MRIAWFVLKVLIAGFALFGAIQLLVITEEGIEGHRRPSLLGRSQVKLSAEQEVLVSGVSRILSEDGVAEPLRWARAIVSATPSADVGYVALVLAQIRRESNFLIPDLEWLYRKVVPRDAEELGFDNPIRTIGPMQVQRESLRATLRRMEGRPISDRELEELSYDIETGVAAACSILDRIVVEYSPYRRLQGAGDRRGIWPYPGAGPSLATDLVDAGDRRRRAAEQLILSDLLDEALVIDGVPGEDTARLEREARRRFGDGDLRGLWETRFGRGGAGVVSPTLTHDPQVAFILADFNAGFAACRIAATQVALNAVDGAGLAVDGKMGPKTREAMFTFFEGHVRRERDRKELRQLVEEGRKRLWVIKHTGRLARDIIRRTEHRDLPQALVPDLSYESTSQTLKGIGRTSVERYAAASARFFEAYYRRLSDYTGRRPRQRAERVFDPGGPWTRDLAPWRARTVPDRR